MRINGVNVLKPYWYFIYATTCRIASVTTYYLWYFQIMLAESKIHMTSFSLQVYEKWWITEVFLIGIFTGFSLFLPTLVVNLCTYFMHHLLWIRCQVGSQTCNLFNKYLERKRMFFQFTFIYFSMYIDCIAAVSFDVFTLHS